MKGYLSVQETADKRVVSIRWMNQYVKDGRVPGAERLGRARAIPESAVKLEKQKSGPKSKSSIVCSAAKHLT